MLDIGSWQPATAAADSVNQHLPCRRRSLHISCAPPIGAAALRPTATHCGATSRLLLIASERGFRSWSALGFVSNVSATARLPQDNNNHTCESLYLVRTAGLADF